MQIHKLTVVQPRENPVVVEVMALDCSSAIALVKERYPRAIVGGAIRNPDIPYHKHKMTKESV